MGQENLAEQLDLEAIGQDVLDKLGCTPEQIAEWRGFLYGCVAGGDHSALETAVAFLTDEGAEGVRAGELLKGYLNNPHGHRPAET